MIIKFHNKQNVDNDDNNNQYEIASIILRHINFKI
jgi:hypothetical protein